MSDLRRLLRDGDPVLGEPDMDPSEAQAMRHALVVAAARAPSSAGRWPGPLVLGTTVAAAIVAGIALGQRVPHPPAETPATRAGAATDSRRQLQFASPGGTRIIWVFDPEFNP